MNAPDTSSADIQCYYMVAVSQTITYCYPLKAQDAGEAEAKIGALLSRNAIRAPRMLVADSDEGTLAIAEPIKSTRDMCEHTAENALKSDERNLLLGEETEKRQGSELSPQQMSVAAKAILRRTGSGALQPSKRRRI